jgi:hypothetical protein
MTTLATATTSRTRSTVRASRARTRETPSLYAMARAEA